MKLVWFFIFSLMASMVSFLGEARADIVRIYLINPEMRYERDSSQDLVNRSPRNFAVSYQYTRWSALLEYSAFSESSTSGTYHVNRDHQEMTLWGRYHIFALNFKESKQTLQAYAGAGAGAYQETVQTNFMTESRKDTGGNKFMSGLSLGGEYTIGLGGVSVLVAGLEGRALISSDFDPNPMWSAVLRLGIGFFL